MERGTQVHLVEGVRGRPLRRFGAGVEVRRSRIPGAGAGLFATTAVRRGDPITQFDGLVVDAAIARRWLDTPERLTHVRTLWAQHNVISGLRSGIAGRGGASLANDAGYTPGGRYDGARNNSKFAEYDIDGVDRIIYLAAVRDIAAGEEITVAYGRDYWKRHAVDANDDVTVIIEDDDVIDVGVRI